MKRKRLPLLLTWIRGAVGREFVIKHYDYGMVKTKFPDMSRIIASARQRKCRNLFKEAVAYAKTVIADPVKKNEWEKKVKIKYRVFNSVIKEYMLAAKNAKEQRQRIAARIIRKCFDPAIQNNNMHGIRSVSAPFVRDIWAIVSSQKGTVFTGSIGAPYL